MKPWPPPGTVKRSVKPPSDSATDPFARYRVFGSALALLIIYFGANELWVNAIHPTCRDFIAFWGAARMAIAGTPALAYSSGALHHLQSAVVAFPHGKMMPFGYMPAFLLLVMPFGILSYPAAMAAWVVVTLLLYLFALKRLVPKARLLAVAFPPVLVNIMAGQNGFVTAALFFAATATFKRRPFVAGLLIGCFALKPQLGLLFPVALLASRQWKAIAGAALSSIGIALAGALVFGSAATLAWIGQLPYFARIARDGTVGWLQLVSFYASARQAGFAAAPALALHALVLTAVGMCVWRIWRSDAEMMAKAAVLACGTMLASPYVFLYDETILVLPFFWLAQRKVHPAVLATLWCIPMVSFAQHAGEPGPVNLGPLLPILLLALTTRTIRKNDGGPLLLNAGAMSPSAAPKPA